MPVYLDTSVVVAYYVPEQNSERVQALFGEIGRPIISELVDLEILAALAFRVRTGDLDTEYARRVENLYGEHLEAELYSLMHLQPEHYRWARDVIARFELPLKSPDALHLAAAYVGGHRLITADRQLARNADALNVPYDLIGP